MSIIPLCHLILGDNFLDGGRKTCLSAQSLCFSFLKHVVFFFWGGQPSKKSRTGARAHMDSHCISTLSVVLHGERRWRIGPVPRLPQGAGRSPDGEVVFDDGVAYQLGWKPMFEFTVKEGELSLGLG